MTLTEFIQELQAVNDRFAHDKIEFMVNLPGDPDYRYRLADIEAVYLVPGNTAGVRLAARRKAGEE